MITPESIIEKYGTGLATILSENIDRTVYRLMNERGFADEADMRKKGYELIIQHVHGQNKIIIKIAKVEKSFIIKW